MSVPETPVHEHYHTKTRQHYIRLPNKFLRMEPEAETGSEQFLAYIEFRQSVRAADCSHHARAFFGTNPVGHIMNANAR
jgi:hypothetical protein